ncbi:MAG: hypothetical protein HWN67_04275 [Candidatus Helarchaeota archaeon]|nr:hypothetical protein [Candidatus Helarchaeota archaeon]
MTEKDDEEVSELQNEIENVLDELSNLEVQFTEILKPRVDSTQAPIDTGYIMAVRRFQNGMRVSLLNGAETGNKETFLEGFRFYEGALILLKSHNDSNEIQQCINELVQILLKIISKAKPKAEENSPYGPFFLRKSCQYIANVYESSGNFEVGMKFHDRAANLSTGLEKELEFLQKLMNALLCNKIEVVNQTLQMFKIKHVTKMATLFAKGFTENNQQKVQSAQNLLETLSVQRKLSINHILSLIEKLNHAMQSKKPAKGEPKPVSQVQRIPAPTQSLHLSNDAINELRTILTDGIKQLKSTKGGAAGDAPLIDTSSIVSEIKSMISQEIKSISSEIVSQLLNKMPAGLPASPRAHSGGTISDDVPDIQVVAAAPGERQARPKLDDMIDSIVVCE